MPQYRLEEGSIQHLFNLSRAKVQIFGGGFGNGKTTALVIKSLKIVRDYPGSNGLLARETYPKLNDTLRKEFFKWCPPQWIKRRPTQEDNTCYLTNGSIVNFRYVAQRGKSREDGSTTSNLLSANYDWIGVDQVEDPGITHKDFLDLMGRLRGQTVYRAPEGEEDPSMPDTGPRFLMLTANPSPNWFYREVVRPYVMWKKSGLRTDKLLVDAETGNPIIDLFEGSTYTNAANLPKDYIQGLESTYKGQMKDRFLLGKWAAYEGLVHSEYSDENKMPQKMMLAFLRNAKRRNVRLKVIEAYDFGLTTPSCYGLFVVDDWGRVFLIDGFYQADFHYSDQPDAINEIRAKYDDFLNFKEPIRADPAIFKKTVVAGKKDTGDTVSKLLKDLGIRTKPASNEIIAGLAKVNRYIAGSKTTPHPVSGNEPAPLLYVAEELEWFENEISNYYWKKNPLGQKLDEPQDTNDHAMNMLKYALSHLPDPSEIVIPKHDGLPGWMTWQEYDVDRRGNIIR